MNNRQDNLGEVVLYKTEDGKTAVDVRLEGDTVWLSQKQMSELFDKNVRTVSEHLRNIFKEGELKKPSVIRNFRGTASPDGGPTTWLEVSVISRARRQMPGAVWQ